MNIVTLFHAFTSICNLPCANVYILMAFTKQIVELSSQGCFGDIY